MVGQAEVGRENAGWTTTKSGRPVHAGHSSYWPPAGKTPWRWIRVIIQIHTVCERLTVFCWCWWWWRRCCCLMLQIFVLWRWWRSRSWFRHLVGGCQETKLSLLHCVGPPQKKKQKKHKKTNKKPVISSLYETKRSYNYLIVKNTRNMGQNKAGVTKLCRTQENWCFCIVWDKAKLRLLNCERYK